MNTLHESVKLSSGIIRRRPRGFSGIIPKNLTEAILLNISHWEESSKNLIKKQALLKDEISQEGFWIFNSKWLIISLKNNFPKLIQRFYGEEERIDEERFRSSVTAILSQSLPAFKAFGFIESFDSSHKLKTYVISPDISFSELRNVFSLRSDIKKFFRQRPQLTRRNQTSIIMLVVDGEQKILKSKDSFAVYLK